jgi:hypothetical protein
MSYEPPAMSYLLIMFWIPAFAGMTMLSHAGGVEKTL